MAVPSALGDVKIVSPISTFVLNTLTLIKCIFFLFKSCSGNEDKHGLHDIASTKDFLSSHHLGIKVFEHGDFKTAQEFFSLELNEAKKNRKKNSEGTACNNLGLACYHSGDFKEAINFISRA